MARNEHLADGPVNEIVGRHVRPGWTFARYGGEEFALLLPGTKTEDAAALAEEILAEVATHAFTFDGHTISVTLSAGVARASPDTCAADRLIRSAEEHLRACRLRR